MKDFEKSYSEGNNQLFIRARLSSIIISSFLYHLILVIIINLVFYLVNSKAYISSIHRHYLLNFISTGVIFFVIAVLHGYCLYREANIQFRNKRIYYDKYSKKYSPIFNAPVSIFFTLILQVFIILSVANYMDEIERMLTAYETLLTVILFSFILLFLYFYVKVRLFLIGLLMFIENNFILAKNKINHEIKHSKNCNLALTLCAIKILNIKEITKELALSKKKSLNYILLNIRNRTRLEDTLVVRSSKDGVIWYLAKMDEETIKYVMENRVLPALKEGIELDDNFLIPKPKWEIVNIVENGKIKSIKDISVS